MYVGRKNEGRSRNHWCRWKAVSITYSECVSVALVIQHATRMRCIIVSSVACPFYTIFAHYLKRHGFWLKPYWT